VVWISLRPLWCRKLDYQGESGDRPVRLRISPEIELHVHLEGSVAADTAVELAPRHGFDPHEVLPLVDGQYPKRFTDIQEFITIYLAVSTQI